jgi:hypothetical protein
VSAAAVIHHQQFDRSAAATTRRLGGLHSLTRLFDSVVVGRIDPTSGSDGTLNDLRQWAGDGVGLDGDLGDSGREWPTVGGRGGLERVANFLQVVHDGRADATSVEGRERVTSDGHVAAVGQDLHTVADAEVTEHALVVSVSQTAVSRAFTSSERRPSGLASSRVGRWPCRRHEPVTHACGAPELVGTPNGVFSVGNVVGNSAEESGLTTTKTRRVSG